LPELEENPIRQFQRWLKEAHDTRILEPNAMTLGTVDRAGAPWTRTVLLKACDERGFSFFTNYNGTKAAHLENNSSAALTFWWGALERQVNITGRVAKVTREESTAYFAVRPLASQLGAWASPQSTPIAGRAELEALFAACKKRFEGVEVPCPEHWGGYRLEPETVEFWQGRRSRLHDRFLFTRSEGGGWAVQRLAP
jgi:pyridoxamine 5'-phosphate oxidase